MRPPRTHGQKFVLDQLKRAIQLPLSDVLVYIGCNIDLGLFFLGMVVSRMCWIIIIVVVRTRNDIPVYYYNITCTIMGYITIWMSSFASKARPLNQMYIIGRSRVPCAIGQTIQYLFYNTRMYVHIVTVK